MYNITGWKGTPQSTQVLKIQDTVGPTILKNFLWRTPLPGKNTAAIKHSL